MMDGWMEAFKMILKDHDNNAVAPQQRVHREARVRWGV
jgi:hypothetical protein